MKTGRNFLYKTITGALFLIAAAGFTACGNVEKDGEATFIGVNKDGSIRSEIVENFAEERYDKDELQTAILGELAVYNKKAGNNITVEKVEKDGDNIVVKMTYAKSADYAAFNKVDFFAGTAAEAGEAGYELNVVLSGVEDSKETVGKSDILAMENTGILITDVTDSIVLDGKALYTSDGVEVSSKGKTVRRIGEEKKLMYVIYSIK
ncbi:MAG: hypothetical protein K2P30_09870 [Lachnospiraceae bacterium]|nr:hypothetical protein [Lachnospiraceae bacterium]